MRHVNFTKKNSEECFLHKEYFLSNMEKDVIIWLDLDNINGKIRNDDPNLKRTKTN